MGKEYHEYAVYFFMYFIIFNHTNFNAQYDHNFLLQFRRSYKQKFKSIMEIIYKTIKIIEDRSINQ